MQQQSQSLNLLRGLWLPDISPSWPLQAPLMLLADRLFFYSPLGAGEEDLAAFADDAVCIGINPVLDDDCDSLAAMMAEVEVHGEEFLAGQLSAMTAPGPGPETAVSRLIGQLRGDGDDNDGREARRRRLNRARFLLVLAELHRRQEEEVSRGLLRAEARQRDLMGELTAVPAPSFSSPTGVYGPAVNYGSLVRAWFTLYFLDPSPPGCFTACFTESWDVITGDAVGEPLLDLEMPPSESGEDPAVWIKSGRDRFAGLLPAVAGMFSDPGTLTVDAGTELSREWNAISGDDCRGRVSVYRMPDHDVTTALAPPVIEDGGKEKKGKHGLVAVLSQG